MLLIESSVFGETGKCLFDILIRQFLCAPQYKIDDDAVILGNNFCFVFLFPYVSVCMLCFFFYQYMKLLMILAYTFLGTEEMSRGKGVLDRNSVCGEKNYEFSFSVKLVSKLVCLANTVVLDSVFSFKSSNVTITNCEFEFNSRQPHLIFKFLQLSQS